jgi:hypothetical protein
MFRHEWKLIFGALLVFSFSASALNVDPKLAHRDPSVSYKVYVEQARLTSRPLSDTWKTPVDEARKYGSAKLPKAQVWESTAFMHTKFEYARDLRWLTTNDKPDFQRRSSWLYPDDGCFARASLAVMNIMSLGASAPNKIFAFGDLRVDTANAPGGEVTWWYHVAPVVEVEGVKYVIDPSIEPRRPLTIDEWLGAMEEDPANIEVAICASGTYEPYDNCARRSTGKEPQATQDQSFYLWYEWNRLLALQRNPEEELGEKPPWLDLTVF